MGNSMQDGYGQNSKEGEESRMATTENTYNFSFLCIFVLCFLLCSATLLCPFAPSSVSSRSSEHSVPRYVAPLHAHSRAETEKVFRDDHRMFQRLPQPKRRAHCCHSMA